MKRIAILHGPRDIRIEEEPFNGQDLGPEQLWVETIVSALKIGTDRGNYEGSEQVPGAPDFPRWVGDSNLGVVRAIGDAVDRFSVGDRVVANVAHQSDYLISQTDAIVRVPEDVHSDDAVYAWLYALSSLCYRKAMFQPGENVAVVGLGVLGLGAVALGPLFGARVLGLGNDPFRLELSQKMGAHQSLLSSDPDLQKKTDDWTNGAGIDLVIQTANPWPAFRTSCEIVRPNGRVAIVALPGRGEPPLDFNPLDMKWFYQKGISLIAVSGQAANAFPTEPARFSRHRECEFILSLMADGKLEPKRLITHRFPYQQMAEAYEMAYRRDKSMLGVLFEW